MDLEYIKKKDQDFKKIKKEMIKINKKWKLHIIQKIYYKKLGVK